MFYTMPALGYPFKSSTYLDMPAVQTGGSPSFAFAEATAAHVAFRNTYHLRMGTLKVFKRRRLESLAE